MILSVYSDQRMTITAHHAAEHASAIQRQSEVTSFVHRDHAANTLDLADRRLGGTMKGLIAMLHARENLMRCVLTQKVLIAVSSAQTQ